ncbi:MAG: transposase [Candidatus Sungbacteria bacterium]|nr:transposase [Candidatus Sungbacteria bacterium]
MKHVSFADDHIYHIYNRGVEKRDIFLSEKDYLRFILNLYEFNSKAPALNLGYQFNRTPIEVRLQYPRKEVLVEILAFCLMPNHYHLMVRQVIDQGITLFMRKLGTGYTNYFNTNYNRVGPLFQGKFKAILLEDEAHFIHLPHYIHLNPLDLTMPEWRNHNVTDFDKATMLLKNYRWSSLLDYIGIQNFPTVIARDFLQDYVGSSIDFLNDMKSWVQNIDFAILEGKTLE